MNKAKEKQPEQKELRGCVSPMLEGKHLYKRVFIRRKTPEEILEGPIRNDADLENKIRALAAWFRDFAPTHNFVIEIGIREVTDAEADTAEL